MSKLSEAKNRYDAKTYDKLLLLMPRGQKDEIKALATAEGISVNRYILEAIEARSGLKLTLDKELPWKK